MNHVKAHSNRMTRQLDKIPTWRLKQKFKDTAIGLVAVGLGIASQVMALFPLWVNLLVIFYGGYAMSKELVRAFAGFAPAVIRDFKDAILNGKGK